MEVYVLKRETNQETCQKLRAYVDPKSTANPQGEFFMTTTEVSLAQSLVEAVRQAGGGDQELDFLGTPAAAKIWKRFGAMVMDAMAVLSSVFTLLVDYDRSVADLLKAGDYRYANPDITDAHFPPQPFETGTADKRVRLYHFGRDIESEAVIAAMKNDGFRPGTAREGLKLGEKQPDLQRQFPIVMLGSVWVSRSGGRGVVFLSGGVGERGASLRYYGYGWLGSCRFLAVEE